MAKLTKRIVDAAEIRASDYIMWDEELPSFGLRVFASGKRSYLVVCRPQAAHAVIRLACTESGLPDGQARGESLARTGRKRRKPC